MGADRLQRYGLAPVSAYAMGLGLVAIAVVAAWFTADLLPRWVTIPVVGLGVGYALLVAPPGARLGRYLLAWAGVFVVAPILLVLPAVLHADDLGVSAGSLVIGEASLLLVVVFWLVAVVVGALGWHLGRRSLPE